MNDLHTAAKLAQDLRTLADRFSEGWHEGIKIDASDIVLLSDAAKALAEQPAQEPVDSMGVPLSCGKPLCSPGDHHLLCKLAEQEPVAWIYQCSADSSGPVLMQHKRDWAESGSGLWTETPLYTHPQAREPLTDEQVAYILGQLPKPPTNDGSALHDWAMQAVHELAAHGIKGDA